jgi:hypothetical protein
MSGNVRFCPVGGEMEKRSQIQGKIEVRIQKTEERREVARRGPRCSSSNPQTSNYIEWRMKK